MVTIRPFASISPTSELVAEVASPPYDVVTQKEASRYIKNKPNSILRVTRSDAEYPEGALLDDEEIYKRAKKNLQQFIDSGVLSKREPALYLYRLARGEQSQTGLVCVSLVKEYNEGQIKIHEKTRPDKEDDRVRHIKALEAQTGPVFLAFRSNPQAAALFKSSSANTPLYDFSDDQGIEHTVWQIEDSAQYVRLFSSIEATYIADGHHRAKAASRVAQSSSGEEGYFLTVIFPDSELKILPYNRLVSGIDFNRDSFFAALEKSFYVEETSDPAPKSSGEICLFEGNAWTKIRLKKELLAEEKSVVESLDAERLQRHLLAPILGIEDPRRDSRLSFVGGIKGTEALEAAVISGEAQLAFSLPAVTIQQLFDVADAGLLMPPKSTWFEPKLLSGLFIYPLS